MKERIAIIGAGGHAKVVIDAVIKAGSFEIAGIVVNTPGHIEIFGIKKIGSDDDLGKILKAGIKNAFVAIGSIGDVSVRQKMSEKLKKAGFMRPAVIHPSAVIACGVKIEEGSFIGAGAVIGPDAVIGANAIINTGACVDHDCKIGAYAHISPGAVLSGLVIVGKNTHVGTGVSVIENIKIGENSMLGAGSVVVGDIPSNCKAYGCPCRVTGGAK